MHRITSFKIQMMSNTSNFYVRLPFSPLYTYRPRSRYDLVVAVSHILCLSYLHRLTVLKQLHWLPVEQRITYKLFMHHNHVGQAPVRLCIHSFCSHAEVDWLRLDLENVVSSTPVKPPPVHSSSRTLRHYRQQYIQKTTQ